MPELRDPRDVLDTTDHQTISTLPPASSIFRRARRARAVDLHGEILLHLTLTQDLHRAGAASRTSPFAVHEGLEIDTRAVIEYGQRAHVHDLGRVVRLRL